MGHEPGGNAGGQQEHSTQEFHAIWGRHKALRWGRVQQSPDRAFPPHLGDQL